MRQEGKLGVSDRAAKWLSPWTGGSRLLTLWDMKEYLTPRLSRATEFMSKAIIILGFAKNDKDDPFPENDRKELKICISKFLDEAQFLGLPITAKAAVRFINSTDSRSPEQLSGLLDQIYSRFFDEAANLPLFYVHQEALKYYNKTDLFGEEFKTGFPTANAEIIEAGNCFAFDRFTACVFHLMRSLEVALKALFRELGLPPLTTAGAQNWNGILREIKDKLDTNKAIPDHAFYESAYAFLAAAKNPMRNATMHVDVIYDEASATTLFDAVGAFMRHIATKLKESP